MFVPADQRHALKLKQVGVAEDPTYASVDVQDFQPTPQNQSFESVHYITPARDLVASERSPAYKVDPQQLEVFFAEHFYAGLVDIKLDLHSLGYSIAPGQLSNTMEIHILKSGTPNIN